MLGYYKEPQLTAEMFEGDWLKTGDEGSIDSEGYLTITGRIKDQFKTSKGKYVVPGNIESKVLSHPFVSQACVVGSGMPAPLLLCTLSQKALTESGSSIVEQLNELLNSVNQQLEHHEQVAKMLLLKDEWTLENGILTPTLKIKRKVVDERFQQQYATWYNQPEPVSFI